MSARAVCPRCGLGLERRPHADEYYCRACGALPGEEVCRRPVDVAFGGVPYATPEALAAFPPPPLGEPPVFFYRGQTFGEPRTGGSGATLTVTGVTRPGGVLTFDEGDPPRKALGSLLRPATKPSGGPVRPGPGKPKGFA